MIRVPVVVRAATPGVWEVRLAEAPAPVTVMRRGNPLTIANLLCGPHDRSRQLPAVILGVERRRYFCTCPMSPRPCRGGITCCAEQGQAVLDGQNCCLMPAMEYLCPDAIVYESDIGRWRRRKGIVRGGLAGECSAGTIGSPRLAEALSTRLR